jgi:hypothetical protein
MLITKSLPVSSVLDLTPRPALKSATFQTLLLSALLLGHAAVSAAGAIADRTGLLGQSLEQVEAAFDSARPVHAPRRLPSGASGLLRQPDVVYEGAHFEQTFYFAQQKLQQIEMVSLPGLADGGFGHLLASLKSQLGPELAAGDSASWVQGDADVVLYRYGRPDAPTVRLLIRQRRQADASEL